jgi:ribonuclease BN (tRNA processing enzyme)
MIQFLGTGSAFTIKNFQSNAIVTIGNKKLLIDCGGDIRHSMARQNLNAGDIDAVYISHMHDDHVGGMQWLGFLRLFTPGWKRPKLFIEGELSRDLWQYMEPGAALEAHKYTGDGDVCLETFFDTERVQKNGHFYFEGIKFDLVQTVHVVAKYTVQNSYGLIWDDPDLGRVFFTTDTQWCPEQLTAIYEEADIIFQDCETTEFKSGVHANYMDLVKHSPDIKKKMVLYHYQDNVLNDHGGISPLWNDKAKKDGFKCFAFQTQLFKDLE